MDLARRDSYSADMRTAPPYSTKSCRGRIMRSGRIHLPACAIFLSFSLFFLDNTFLGALPFAGKCADAPCDTSPLNAGGKHMLTSPDGQWCVQLLRTHGAVMCCVDMCTCYVMYDRLQPRSEVREVVVCGFVTMTSVWLRVGLWLILRACPACSSWWVRLQITRWVLLPRGQAEVPLLVLIPEECFLFRSAVVWR